MPDNSKATAQKGSIERDECDNVVFLGVQGSGKSVLTLALARIFRQHEADGWYLKPGSRSEFRFLEQSNNMLVGSNMPSSTSSLSALSWHVTWNGETVRRMDVLDYPGEIYRLAFLDTADDSDPGLLAEKIAANRADIDALLEHLSYAKRIFVLFNLADAEDIARNEANLDAVWVTHKCLDYLSKLPGNPEVTLLMTQIGRYVPQGGETGEKDVARLYHEKLPLLWRNHPEINLCAAELLDECDTKYSIDTVVRICMQNYGPVLQKRQEAKNALERLQACCAGTVFNGIHPGECSSCIRNAAATYSSSFKCLPWFLQYEFPFSPQISADVETLAGTLDDFNLQSCADAIRCREAAATLKNVATNTPFGRQIRDALSARLDAFADETERERAEAEKARRKANGCLLALSIIVAFLLYRFIHYYNLSHV